MVRHGGSENRHVEVRPNVNAFLQRGQSAWLLRSCAAFLAINSAERERGIAALQATGVFLIFAWRAHLAKLFPEVSKSREQCLVNRHLVTLLQSSSAGGRDLSLSNTAVPLGICALSMGQEGKRQPDLPTFWHLLKKGQGSVFKFPFLFLLVG